MILGWSKPEVKKREEDGVYVVFWQGDLDFNYFEESDLRQLLRMIEDKKKKESGEVVDAPIFTDDSIVPKINNIDKGGNNEQRIQ